MSMLNVTQIDRLLREAGLDIVGVSNVDDTKAGLRIDWAASPTSQDLASAQVIIDTYDQAAEEAAWTQLFATIKQAAQSAVGVPLNDLTPAQRNALLALLLALAGGVHKDGTVAPLDEWARPLKRQDRGVL